MNIEELIIHLPNKLNNKNAFRLSNHLNNIKYAKKVVFDFSYLNIAFPFATLFSMSNIKRFINRIESECGAEFFHRHICLDTPCHGYLSHIGFFQALGIDIGKKPGEAKGSEAYVPITMINKEEIFKVDQSDHYGEKIVEIAEDIANVITCSHKKDSECIYDEYIYKFSSYSIREIIRNCFEHGEADHAFVSAQYYPKPNIVEVAVIDEGIGLKKSLSAQHSIANDQEVIDFALKPGISGKDITKASDDKWSNSGFGLYITSQLCTHFENSQFCIASDGFAKTLYYGGKSWVNNVHIDGTAVMLKFSINDDYYFETLLERIIRAGEGEARLINPNISASKMSKTVSLSS